MNWPDGKQFAFSVFDDPDGQTEEQSRTVYSFLADNGFRTTKAVWPIGPYRERSSGGTTCSDTSFRHHCQELRQAGFEIAYHNAAPHSCFREETISALDRFREYFGADPVTMANHYDEDAIYWGSSRLDGVHRHAYNVMTFYRRHDKQFGHIPEHPMFWGDICRQRVGYCRGFVFPDVNTLRNCPFMPYYDPRRPFVRAWFAGTDGHNYSQFLKVISEENQERLARSGGACIMYTHFGHGFVENGRLEPKFRVLMKGLANRAGYFAPVSEILEYMKNQQGIASLAPGQRFSLQSRWLLGKLVLGPT